MYRAFNPLVDGSLPQRGDAVTLSFVAERLQLFDPASGRRL